VTVTVTGTEGVVAVGMVVAAIVNGGLWHGQVRVLLVSQPKI
jgi:hypothetical protein